ncbi:MAG: hypothetical protein AB7P40_15990 [Chloroflexota bacterium]
MSRLGVVVVLLLGLVISTPVSCVCGPADHGDLALHSLLPHTHQHPATPIAEGLAAGAEEVVDAFGADVRVPGLRAQTGMGGIAAAISGAIGLTLVTPWAIVPAPAGSLRLAHAPAPMAPHYQPPGPPPRFAAS